MNAPSKGHGETILIVDDEHAVRIMLQRTLEISGFKVITAAEGDEALKVFDRDADSIQVVITDLRMPSMDGVRLSKALKTRNPHVKIIGSSGLADHEKLNELRAVGVEHFLTKPYTRAKLLSMISDVLNSPS